MKKRILLTAIAFSTLFVACNDDDSDTLAMAPNTTIVGFSSESVNKSYTTDMTNVGLSIPVQLISYVDEQLPTEDISVNWRLLDPSEVIDLDPSDFETTADYEAAYDAELDKFASEGVEFESSEGSSGTVLLVAGESIKQLSFDIHPSSLIIGSPKKFVLELSDATNAVVGYQYRRVTITLNGACASNLAGNYIIPYTVGNYPVVITEIGTGDYMSTLTPGWTTSYTMYFRELCGDITIYDWAYNSDYPITGSGYLVDYDGDGDQDIYFETITVEGLYDNRQFVFLRD
jgi:hypothetical protein